MVCYRPDVPTGHGRFVSISLNSLKEDGYLIQNRSFFDKSMDDGRFGSAVRIASAVL
jgi:hypothetical protein